jgi:hypothetical protein
LDASTLVSLEMVCSSLKSALTSDALWAQALDNGHGDPEFLEDPKYEGLPTWREYALRESALANIRMWQEDHDNIIQYTLGDGDIYEDDEDGVRNLARSLLRRMNPAVDEAIHQMHLREDAVSCLSAVLDDYMITKLTRAFDCTTFRSGPDDKDPILHAYDIAFLSKVDGIGTGMSPNATARAPFIRFSTRPGHGIAWTWPADHCSDVLSSDESRLLIRRFAYKAGICKIDSRAFEFAISDFLHTMSLLLIDAFEACKGMAPDNIEALKKQKDPRYMHQEFCPFRSDEDEKIVCTITARQIRDAASRYGLKPLYGYNRTDWMGCQYFVEGDGYESAEDMNIDEEDDLDSNVMSVDEIYSATEVTTPHSGALLSAEAAFIDG